eukprot:Awhi_evm1s7125
MDTTMNMDKALNPRDMVLEYEQKFTLVPIAMKAQNKKGNSLGKEILVAMDPPGGIPEQLQLHQHFGFQKLLPRRQSPSSATTRSPFLALPLNLDNCFFSLWVEMTGLCVNGGEDLLSVLKQRANGGPFQPQIYGWRNKIAFVEMYET